MALYHATRRHRLASILAKGLRSGEAQNFECMPGVYLADSPIIAFGFLIEDYLLKADETSKPSRDLKNFIVIVVDDARIDETRLEPDPNVGKNWQGHLFRYEGVIDVNGMPILDADVLFPDREMQDIPMPD